MSTSGDPQRGLGALEELFADIERVQASHADRHPGLPGPGQPIHTVYVPAHRFSERTVAEFGSEAERLLIRHAPDVAALADAFAFDASLATRVRPRLADKLRLQPIEDLRVDFEDGYGIRDDEEEDRHARQAAHALAATLRDDLRPRRVGLRVKSFADGQHRRSVRTLQVFLDDFVDHYGDLPGDVVVTFPKIVAVDHVRAFAAVLDHVERQLGLPTDVLKIETQIETPSSILGPDGRVPLRDVADAAQGRLRAAPFGVFDYTAALGLPPAEQRLTHPACDAARHAMQIAFAGTGIELSDGSTILTPAHDDTATVHAAWRRHAVDVRHSLAHGYWQGWDLHPSHLVSRFATVYAFYLADIDGYVARIRAWSHGEPGPGGFLDEPATVRVLLAQARRAVACGAVAAEDLPADMLKIPDMTDRPNGALGLGS